MSVYLEMYAQGANDPAEAEMKTYCDWCGGEIYAGSEVYKFDDDIIYHTEDDCDCIWQVLSQYKKSVEEALREE